MFLRRIGRVLFGRVEPRMLFICVLSAVHFIGATMPRFLIPLHLADMGTSPALTGLVVSTYALFPLFIALPGGVLIDRLGSRATILAGCALGVLSAYLLVQFPSISMVTAATILAGIGNVLVVVAGQSYVAAIGSARSRANDFAVFGFSTATGQLLGPLLGGAISTAFGRSVAFGGFGVTAVLAALITLRLPPGGEQSRRVGVPGGESEGVRELASMARDLLRDPRAQMSILISGCALGAFSINTSFYPVFLQSIGYSDGVIGALGSVRQMSALVVRPALGYLVATFGTKGTVQRVLLVGAVAIGGTPFFMSWLPLAILAGLGGTTTALTQPISMIMMADGADGEHRGLAMGLRLTGNRLVQFIGPVLLGMLVGYLGIAWSFYGSALILVVGAGLLYWRYSELGEVEESV